MKRLPFIALGLTAAVLGLALLLAPHNGGEDRTSVSGAAPPRSAAVPPPAPPAQTQAPVHEPSAPVDAAALRDEADRLIADGKVMEGIDVFRRAVAADPTARNHGDLGALLYRLTAYDEAARHLSAAAELDPMNADRWIALANVYYRKVDLGKAWKAEQHAREAEPGLELARDGSGMRIRKDDKASRQP